MHTEPVRNLPGPLERNVLAPLSASEMLGKSLKIVMSVDLKALSQRVMDKMLCLRRSQNAVVAILSLVIAMEHVFGLT